MDDRLYWRLTLCAEGGRFAFLVWVDIVSWKSIGDAELAGQSN